MAKSRSSRAKRPTASRRRSPSTKSTGAKRQRPAAAGNSDYRVRVRMYRHGLGDCFLVSFRREGLEPYQLLIDCGALARSGAEMVPLAERIEAATKGANGKSRLDLVIATHEHRDHLSGFNQARDVFDRIEIGRVWMGWTENPEDDDAKDLLAARTRALTSVRAALASPRGVAASIAGALSGVAPLLAFSDGEDTAVAGRRTIADALDYLRQRGTAAGALEYLEPGKGPLALDGVEKVRTFVLGPPRESKLLLDSSVTKKRIDEGSIYHLAGLEMAAIAALDEALGLNARPGGTSPNGRHRPFPKEHAIARGDHWYGQIRDFVERTYDLPSEDWRRIDHDWIESYGRLALKLANDTNNTSLVVAFELEDTGDVLLFVGDAQVGNWLSWKDVTFRMPGRDDRLSALDLVRRTVFYKVGHHASHNATLKKQGLELMKSDQLVAFIPLDKPTAAAQGRKDPETGKPKGWDMPAGPLFEALQSKTAGRVVISDAAEAVPQAALDAGVAETPEWVDWYYR